MNSIALRMQHTSLQYSDTPKQQEHDVRALFEIGDRFPIKTGTEAGQDGPGGNTNRELLIKFADEFNHLINFGADAWVAVDRSIMVPHTIEHEDVFLVSNDEKVGIGGNRVMPTVSFNHINPYVGRIHVGAVHLYTDGRQPGDPNYKLNVQAVQTIDRWLDREATGPDLGFVNGDFNIIDRSMDVALGRNFTSMADKLSAWQDTGHGPIDAFCSYDRDDRVRAHRFDVLDDSEQQLFSDHFLCHGTWEVQLLQEAS